MINQIKNQNGFALVITLLLMVSISTIGLLALMNASTETLITRNEKEQKIAFQVAEAGLNEAYARVHLACSSDYYLGERTSACGAKPADANYRTANWATDGSKDLGYNKTNETRSGMSMTATNNYSVTIRYATENTTDNFCDSNDNSNVQNTSVAGANYAISPVTSGSLNCSGGEVVMYGKDFGFTTATIPSYGYQPVYKITSTATYGNTSVILISYIASSWLNTRTQSAIDTYDTPASSTTGGATSITSNPPAAGYPCNAAPGTQLTTTNGCVRSGSGYDLGSWIGADVYTTIKDMADERHYCRTSNCSYAGDDIPSSTQIDNVVTNWGDYAGGTSSVLLYIDNDSSRTGVGGAGDPIWTTGSSGGVKIAGNITGRGILVVTGDLVITGTVQWDGLIYVMDQLEVQGTVNVRGGIVSKDVVTLQGSVSVEYNQAILDAVGKEVKSSTQVVRWSRQ